MRRRISPNYMLQEGEQRQIAFSIVRNPGEQEPRITLNEEATLFLSAIVGTAVESFGRLLFSDDVVNMHQKKAVEAAKQYIEQITTIGQQSFKRCTKCKLDNDGNAKFCKNCANKLE